MPEVKMHTFCSSSSSNGSSSIHQQQYREALEHRQPSADVGKISPSTPSSCRSENSTLLE
jgi:hypothetical protein